MNTGKNKRKEREESEFELDFEKSFLLLFVAN